MVEMASIVAGFTLETRLGPQTGESLMHSLSKGQLPMKIEALTDSYSIFSYLAVAHLKLPAEKSTYYHLAYLREKLVSGLISSYNWTDTRDMVADGLTKGSADRSALSAIMDGTYELHHAVHEYREPGSSASTDRRVSFDPDVRVSEPTYVWATAALSSELCATSGGCLWRLAYRSTRRRE